VRSARDAAAEFSAAAPDNHAVAGSSSIEMRSRLAPASPTRGPAVAHVRARMWRRELLVCGIVSSVAYVAADVLGALHWEGYSYTGQAISELSAIGAPSRRLVAPLFFCYTLLALVFGLAVWSHAGATGRVRVAGGALIAIGLLDLLAPFFPMHLRGSEITWTDTMHKVLTGVTVVFIVLAIGFAATAARTGFRLYSIATIGILLTFGAIAARYAPQVEAGLPTPWLGVLERICVFSYLLWQAVLAVLLLRRRSVRAGARSTA
jgi:hypothetical membrane protein